jgi:hypothetical protein
MGWNFLPSSRENDLVDTMRNLYAKRHYQTIDIASYPQTLDLFAQMLNVQPFRIQIK